MKEKVHIFKSIGTVSVLLLLLVMTTASYSQDVASTNLTWLANQTTDLRSQSSSTFSCSFKTTGSRSVVWLQRNGQVSTQYTVTATEGTWSDVSSKGSFTYTLSRDNKSGKMILEKNSSGTFITLDFSESSEYGIKQRFRIGSVEVSN